MLLTYGWTDWLIINNNRWEWTCCVSWRHCTRPTPTQRRWLPNSNCTLPSRPSPKPRLSLSRNLPLNSLLPSTPILFSNNLSSPSSFFFFFLLFLFLVFLPFFSPFSPSFSLLLPPDHHYLRRGRRQFSSFWQACGGWHFCFFYFIIFIFFSVCWCGDTLWWCQFWSDVHVEVLFYCLK